MSSWMRFVGVLNAGIWLGAGVFASFFLLPIFFKPPVTLLVHRYFAGRIAQIALGKYFTLQFVCILVAIIYLVLERMASSRTSSRLRVGIVAVLLGLNIFGHQLLPRMERWHHVKYAPNTTAVQKEEASRSFSRWHAISQVANLLGLALVGVYFWQTVNPAPTTRFNPSGVRR